MVRKQAIYKSWSANELEQLYRTHTANELAEKYNVSVSTVRRGLHYYGIYKTKEQGENHIMRTSLYVTYKGMIVDVMGSIVVEQSKYNTIEDKSIYMFQVLLNHIHGIGSSGLISILSAHEEEARSGYSDEPTSEPKRGFHWDRFIVNNTDFATAKNKDMIEHGRKGGVDEKV